MGSELEPCPNCETIRNWLHNTWLGYASTVKALDAARLDAFEKMDAAVADASALRARVAELEAKLAESEDWKNSLANDVIRTSHENMELQAKLAAATKRAGEERA